MNIGVAKELIRKQISIGTVWTHPDYYDNADGLAQAFHGADREPMVTACIDLLTDPDVVVRSAIISALSHLTEGRGAEWLTAIVEEHPELYVGVEPVGTQLNQPDLEKEIIIAIAEAIQPGDLRSLEYLRKQATAPMPNIWVLPTLAKIDGDWLCEHASLVPYRMVSVLLFLNTKQREKLVHALAPWPVDILEQISSEFWNQLPHEEAESLQKIIRGENF